MIPRPVLFLVSSLLALPAWAAPAGPAPAVQAAGTVDITSFTIREADTRQRLTVTAGPNRLRIDRPDDTLTVLYDPATQHFTGLETNNDTYWEFSWPEVRAQAEESERNANRLKELTITGLDDYATSPATNVAGSAAPPEIVSGYVWKPSGDRKRIAGRDCVRWTGETAGGGMPVEAWCCEGRLPALETALARIREINEPMAVVALREIAPTFVFMVYDDLLKGGVTPLLIRWGDGQDKNEFAFVETKSRPAGAKLFAIPSTYRKTTLMALESLQSPPPAAAHPDNGETPFPGNGRHLDRHP